MSFQAGILDLKGKIDLFRRTCREVASLIVSREDRSLYLRDRIALRLHLLVCEACPKFENQVLTMRTALAKWRHDGHEPGATDAVNSSETLRK